ncbi:hypothetical protein [Rubellicoccus peritrichatus]|uniref:Uncharacterized protein n=1 Tax=Rubellicoccus peritrichatus TaxID=3080537 RepID=A0AAQ3LA47_9BACT|nr:hypothetical protein [Puniceicoccus sp. CR14]WOO40749.1 hypothetical protein RZN69_19170 [Puniceicoccus sp. CR14]
MISEKVTPEVRYRVFLCEWLTWKTEGRDYLTPSRKEDQVCFRPLRQL